MPTIRIVLDTRRAKKDNTFPVKIGVFNERDMLFNTGISSKKENWDNTNSLVTKADINYKTKNAAIQFKVNKIRLLFLSLEREEVYSVSDKTLKSMIEEALSGKKSERKKLIQSIEEHISSMNKPNTILSYLQTLDKVKDYDSNAELDYITLTWLKGFESSMVGLSVNTKAIHLRNLRSVINYAIDVGYTTNYPFRKYRIKREETPKRSLTIDQVRMFRTFECEPHMEQYRDMFFLTIYLCGINLADLVELKKINSGRIEYHRKKTNTFYSIKVEQEAMDIINKYRGKNYLLNILERYSDYRSYNSRLNKMLKDFGEVTKGKKGKKTFKPLFPNISIYWARHTFATLAAELDIPDETISLALGHKTTNSTTAIYINRNLKKVDEANRKIIDYINT